MLSCWLVEIYAPEGGTFLPYMVIVKNLLLLKCRANFQIMLQKCSMGNIIQDSFKPWWLVKKHGLQGAKLFGVLIFSFWPLTSWPISERNLNISKTTFWQTNIILLSKDAGLINSQIYPCLNPYTACYFAGFSIRSPLQRHWRFDLSRHVLCFIPESQTKVKPYLIKVCELRPWQ